jgi:hypothetical protein
MMKCVNLTLVRFIQLGTVVFYSYIVFIYVGALFLLPLAGIHHLYGILSFLGFNTFLAALFAIAIIASIVYLGYKIPNFFLVIRDFGLELINLGFNQVKKFSAIAEEIKNSPANSNTIASETSEQTR